MKKAVLLGIVLLTVLPHMVMCAKGGNKGGGGGGSTPTTPTIVQQMDSHDSNNWMKGDWTSGGIFWCGWDPANIAFDSSIMTITMDDLPCNGETSTCHGKPYASGIYQTYNNMDFGTYSARIKTTPHDGIVHGFFMFDDVTHD